MGDRIVGFGGAGEWTQRCAVAVDQIAVLPVKIDFAAGVAVTVAGVTALRALRVPEPIVDQRILITSSLWLKSNHPSVAQSSRLQAGILPALGLPNFRLAVLVLVTVSGPVNGSDCALPQ